MPREFMQRVDDSILVASGQLAHLRHIPLRAAIRDFQASCIENLRDSRGTADEDIWRTRVDRCDLMLQEPSDDQLRRRMLEARENDR